MSVRELCILEKYGCIPACLTDGWNNSQKYRTGFILSHLETWEVTRDVRNVFLMIATVSVSLAISEVQMLTMWGCVITFLAFALLAQVGVLFTTPQLARFAEDVQTAYEAHLPILGEAARKESVSFAACTLLVDLAENIILLQRNSGIVSPEAEKCRAKFKETHALFLRFGIVQEDWKFAFEHGEKKIAEREALRKSAVAVES